MQDHPVVTNTSRRRTASTTTLRPSQTDNGTMPDQARPSHQTSPTQHEQTQTSQAPATSTRRRTTHRQTPNIGVRRAPHSLNSMDHFLHHDDDRLMGMISAGVSNTTTAANNLDQQHASYHATEDGFVQADLMVYSNPIDNGHHAAVSSNTSHQFHDIYYVAEEDLAGIGSQFDDGSQPETNTPS
ncbi:hypothetical protein MGN70_001081 [Eutypa lata]|nr:hypothetical protein MGN70_001081 [Eutypa lata]